jgi:hypothetical protein
MEDPKPEQQPIVSSGITNKRIFNVTKPHKQPFNIMSVSCSTPQHINQLHNHPTRIKQTNKPATDTIVGINEELQIASPPNDLNGNFEQYKKYCKAYCINIILANQV